MDDKELLKAAIAILKVAAKDVLDHAQVDRPGDTPELVVLVNHGIKGVKKESVKIAVIEASIKKGKESEKESEKTPKTEDQEKEPEKVSETENSDKEPEKEPKANKPKGNK